MMLLNPDTVVYYKAKSKIFYVTVHEHNIIQPMSKLQVFNFLSLIIQYNLKKKEVGRMWVTSTLVCGSVGKVGQEV